MKPNLALPDDSVSDVDVPLYEMSVASYYLDLAPSTLRTWVAGRPYTASGERKFWRPLIERPDPASTLLSFTNLVEAHVLRTLRRIYGRPLFEIRGVIDKLKLRYGEPNPLARHDLWSDGTDLWVKEASKSINLTDSKQELLGRCMEENIKRIIWKDRVAIGLWPFYPNDVGVDRYSEVLPQPVLVDMRLRYGDAVINGTGIPAEALISRWEAGELPRSLASDFRITEDKINYVILWHNNRAKAAA